MAATAFGKTWRLNFGDDSDPIVYKTLGGEKSFDWNRASNDIDTSDKDGPSGVYVPGRLTFSGQGTIKLPDAGFTIVSAAAKSGAPIPLKITDGAIVKYQGQVTVGNWKSSFPEDGVGSYSFDLSNYGVPTVDALDATA